MSSVAILGISRTSHKLLNNLSLPAAIIKKLSFVLKASKGAIDGCLEPIGSGISFFERYLAIAFSKIAI